MLHVRVCRSLLFFLACFCS
jgi:hypothetical protein